MISKTIHFSLPSKVKWDTQSECWIIYNKKYNISGYGPTMKKAKIMFISQIDQILKDDLQR